MQNKGLIWTFIVLLSLACLYQLSFTWVVSGVEADAKDYSNGDPKAEERYLDSMSSVEVYPIFGFTYAESKKNELNLGLDLKGGMNVTLEVSVEDVVKALASNSQDETFTRVIDRAKELKRESDEDYVTLFESAWKEVAVDKQMTAIFYTLENKDRIERNASNEEVIAFIREEAESAFDRSFEVLRTRVNLFGVAQPNIQKLAASDRILVELPGVKDKDRVRQLLQGTAKLEFWETYENQEVYPMLAEANTKLKGLLLGEESDKVIEIDSADAIIADTTVEIAENNEELLSADSTLVDTAVVEEENLTDLISAGNDTDSLGQNQQSLEEFTKENPLFAVLTPAIFQNEQGSYSPGNGPAVGFSRISDTAKVNEYLRMEEIQAMFPSKLKLLWTAKPYDDAEQFLQLIAIKVNNRDGKAPLEGDVITDAFQDFSPMGGRPEITMKMDAVGAKEWKAITKSNVGSSIAIVLDNYVYSFPNVNQEISGGVSSIEGDFTIDEAKLIANILKAGKLPAPAKIVEEAIVGPSLGQEAITSGLSSFMIALVIVLIYMVFYYGKAGLASDIALLANLFFVLGVLASTNIALTLPGIACIVLTIGMSVDSNVLIYERIREELAAGKGARLAIEDGYKNAYSSILDANVTTLLTGAILWFFGTGPVEGFAKTLVIGIFTSLFSAIFITRLIFAWRLDNKKKITVSTSFTEGAFQNIALKFVTNRKKFYIFSGILILVGIGSFATKGLSYGIDFTGGRTYLVRFDQEVNTTDVRNSLQDAFVTASGVNLSPEVKTFGNADQVKITTSYLIDSEDIDADDQVEGKLNEGLAQMNLNYEIMSSQKVGPTIADDIKSSSFWAIAFSLVIIFLYIVFRFRKWQYGLGAIVAIFHDVLIVLAIFSIFYGILPFSLEIDQAFIAAILTVVGYSINDTVVVFDRIREYLGMHKKAPMEETINNALNSTLSRTFNTSLSTIFVLLMIFLFGGEVIRGFAFALLVGVIVGTYSSLCIATPVVVDLAKRDEQKRGK